MRVGVTEDPGWQHLGRGEADAGNDVGGGECDLFDLGKVVVGIAVQLEDANLDDGTVAVRPHLGEVEWVPARALGPGIGLRLGHDLHLHLPFRELASLDRAEQILLSGFARTADYFGRLRLAPVPMPLSSLKVQLHPHAPAGRADATGGVPAITV